MLGGYPHLRRFCSRAPLQVYSISVVRHPRRQVKTAIFQTFSFFPTQRSEQKLPGSPQSNAHRSCNPHLPHRHNQKPLLVKMAIFWHFFSNNKKSPKTRKTSFSFVSHHIPIKFRSNGSQTNTAVLLVGLLKN